MSEVRSALVIGGGIAGPVAAMALRKAGIEATLFEAYPPESVGIGGGLGLAPNGLAALDIVGAGDAVRAVANPIPHMTMMLGGKPAVSIPTMPGVEPLHQIRRGDLHKALHDVAVSSGVHYKYGKRFVNFDDHGDHVTAHFEDGGSATADILIGADGIRSSVRALIDPDAPGPQHTKMIGFGAYLDHATSRQIDLEPGTMVFNFGKKAYYLYWREPDGRVAWGANLPWSEYLTIGEAKAVPAEKWLAILRETYAEDSPGALMAAATTPEALETTGALHIMKSTPVWHRGRVVLVGDAAHSPSNSTGQGASMAIESAVQLARCLRDLPDPTAAFTAYEGLRRARVDKVTKRGARSNSAKAPGPVAKVFMRALMPIMFRPSLVEKTLGAEYRARIDWDAPVSV